VAGEVLGEVLALAVLEVGRLHHDARAVRPRTFAVRLGIVDPHQHRVRHLASPWRGPVVPHVSGDHGAVACLELRAVVLADAQALDESECSPEPCDRLANVRIDQDGNDGRRRDRSVLLHEAQPSRLSTIGRMDEREAFETHYGLGVEQGRLTAGGDHLELVRTLELIEPVLPGRPADVLDVGGGPGIYAARLARAGHRVRLLDVVPLHVEQAAALAGEQPDATFTAELGDARDLEAVDSASMDVVLLLGPLYHLTERSDRVRALAEARRVVRPDGVVVAVVISRLASLFDGTKNGFVTDPRFIEIVKRDLREGQHRNPDNTPDWFTTAFFHRPEEIAAEVEAADLALERLAGVEGPGNWVARWPEQEDLILQAARLAEDVPEVSAHMLAIARPVSRRSGRLLIRRS